MAILDSPWIAYRKPNPEAYLRLFCFHYAGGGASAFHAWSSSAPPEIEICPIQLPGRETRLLEPIFTQTPALIQSLASALEPFLADKPFAFYGHSMGALISFELGRYLRRWKGPDPIHLFVSSCAAPHKLSSHSNIHSLPEAALIEELRSFNGTSEEILQHPELMRVLLPTIRADFAVVETYTYSPGEPFAFPISVFGGWEDKLKCEELKLWKRQTSGPFSLRMFPGNHFFLRESVVAILQTMYDDLEPLFYP